MTLKDVRKYALSKGVKPLGKKADLIRAIQSAEGLEACFGTRPAAECREVSCLWRQDCMLVT